MTDRRRNKHLRVGSDHWCAAGPMAQGGRLSANPPDRPAEYSSLRRVLPRSDSASGILTGMATRRKPKNPGGRPAVWGPRHTMSIRPPEGLYSKLEDAAEAAGLTVAEYCVVEL